MVRLLTVRDRPRVDRRAKPPICALLPICRLAPGAAPEWRFCTGLAWRAGASPPGAGKLRGVVVRPVAHCAHAAAAVLSDLLGSARGQLAAVPRAARYRRAGRSGRVFPPGDELFWRGQWKTATEDGFLQALRERPASANGVWGSKMMWNYFGDALGRLRAWPRLGLGPGAADPAVLAAAFPELRYVWLRRGDKSRQAISWWRAAATGQYALADGEQPAPPPPFDRDAIARLVRYAEECEAGWRDWFTAHAIAPFEIVYEDMTGDLPMTVRELAAFSALRCHLVWCRSARRYAARPTSTPSVSWTCSPPARNMPGPVSLAAGETARARGGQRSLISICRFRDWYLALCLPPCAATAEDAATV
jgi:hypothetical protein